MVSLQIEGLRGPTPEKFEEILVSNAFVVCWPAKGWRSWPKAAPQAGPKSMPELVGLAQGSLKRKMRIKVKMGGEGVNGQTLLSGAAISGTAMVFLVLPARRIAKFFFPWAPHSHFDKTCRQLRKLEWQISVLLKDFNALLIISKSFGFPGDMRIKQK